MRPAGDAVIARTRVLRIDQERERAALCELEGIGNAEHLRGILRPVDAVAGEVPAIGRLAYGFQDLFEIEAAALVTAWRGNSSPRWLKSTTLGAALLSLGLYAAEPGQVLRGSTQLRPLKSQLQRTFSALPCCRES